MASKDTQLKSTPSSHQSLRLPEQTSSIPLQYFYNTKLYQTGCTPLTLAPKTSKPHPRANEGGKS